MKTEAFDTDVLVIGGGNAALCAALMAREAGSRVLLDVLLAEAGIEPEAVAMTEAAHSHTEVGLAVLQGRADAGLAVAAVAGQLGLPFVPLAQERYDLVMRRRDYFEPPVQALLAFARTLAARARAEALGGYRTDGLGIVRYNAPV